LDTVGFSKLLNLVVDKHGIGCVYTFVPDTPANITKEHTMRIADKSPEAVKSPVRVTADRYDLYYANPILLGQINRIGGYWFTSDNMRFVSSRNALDYLAKLYDLLIEELKVAEKFQEKLKAGTHLRQGAEAAVEVRIRKKKPISTDDLHNMIVQMGYTKSK